MPDERPPEPGVLDSLPSKRPQRRSAKRDGSGATAAAKPPRKPAAQRARKPPARAKPVAAQGYEADRTPVEPPTRADIAASAVEAAGELAQIGLTLGEQLLRSIVKRLPKP
jgi:hypothetical protein